MAELRSQVTMPSYLLRHPIESSCPRPVAYLLYISIARSEAKMSYLSCPLLQCGRPGTSIISANVDPSFTTPHLSIRGSTATVFFTNSLVFGEQSYRMMKWCPLSCLICARTFGFVSRKGPQFLKPRTTPPECMTIAPAMRAILNGGLEASVGEMVVKGVGTL